MKGYLKWLVIRKLVVGAFAAVVAFLVDRLALDGVTAEALQGLADQLVKLFDLLFSIKGPLPPLKVVAPALLVW